VYAPTFIALGSVVHDLEYPNLQLIGADGYPKLVQAIMGTIPMWKETEWRWLTHREAEIAKIAVNSFITMKITFANEIGQICHRQGADADKVLHTVGVDPRIGTKYLTAGAGFGGPCFPRDNRALEHETRDDSLMSHIDRLNTHHAEFIVREAARAWALVTDVNNPVKTFTVLGLAYKEGTPHKIESFGVLLTRLLQRRGFTEIHEGEGAPSLVVLALPMEKSDFRKCFIEGTVVFDLWRAHRYLRHEPIHYVPFGG
jgi:UDPglucose 6-dehydrogenase